MVTRSGSAAAAVPEAIQALKATCHAGAVGEHEQLAFGPEATQQQRLRTAVLADTAGAVARFREKATQSLTIAGEAHVPLSSGVRTRFVVFRRLKTVVTGASEADTVVAPVTVSPAPAPPPNGP